MSAPAPYSLGTLLVAFAGWAVWLGWLWRREMAAHAAAERALQEALDHALGVRPERDTAASREGD